MGFKLLTSCSCRCAGLHRPKIAENQEMMQCFHGGLLHCPTFGSWELLEEALICVQDGVISNVLARPSGEDADHLHVEWNDLLQKCRADGVEYHRLAPGCFVTPGFVDCHIHAPQYSYAGNGLDLPLMSWLQKYTFPSEARMSDTARADAVYTACVQRTLQLGTTTACYFGTIHVDATLALGAICRNLGQRALAGLVSMDVGAPEDYSRTSDECLEDLNRFVTALRAGEPAVPAGDIPLVQPCITPRFVPTCSLDLLNKLGEAAQGNPPLHVQSHIAESLDCVAVVRDQHPDTGDGRETAILDQAGLLTNRSVMAHGIHLSDAEASVLAARGTAIAHCPLSNAYFAHGVLRVRELLGKGIKIGLGTDVAGGYSPAMLSAIRSAVTSSRMLQDGVDKFDFCGSSDQQNAPTRAVDTSTSAALTMKEALWLATVGGAEALDMGSHIGTIHVGKKFDCLVVDPCRGMAGGVLSETEPVITDGSGQMEVSVEKWLHNGDDRNITQVYVQGRLVAGADFD